MRPPRPKRRSRPFVLVLLLAAAGALFYSMRCGDGFGIGPGGGGLGSDEPGDERADTAKSDAPADDSDGKKRAVGTVRRCQLRLDAGGLRLDGDETSVEKAVSACKKAGGAELTATGDAVIGDLERIREALDRAGVEVFERSGGAP